jgi:hypothetical protein
MPGRLDKRPITRSIAAPATRLASCCPSSESGARRCRDPISPEGTLPPPVYGLHHDLVADTVTCELAAGVAEQQGFNSSRYTVSNRNPAEVSIESSFFYRASHPALDIRVEARCLTKSDATSYTHSSTVDIKVDGQRYFYKDWTTTVPRGGS